MPPSLHQLLKAMIDSVVDEYHKGDADSRMEYRLRLGCLCCVTEKGHRQSRHHDADDLVLQVNEILNLDPLEELFLFLADE